MTGKKGQRKLPKKPSSLFETGVSKRKEKVMYDPYNLSAVVERFKAEEKAKRKKEGIAKSVATRKQKRIETAKETIKSGEPRLEKLSKKLEKATVTGPLGGKIKVKTLKKITGGAPGLDRGIRSKMYIGKKLNMGGVMKNRGGTFKGIY
tara:strand:+ start:104 stop:550 length:447 start_codon:yes stop_codon:yes gene_type:complete